MNFVFSVLELVFSDLDFVIVTKMLIETRNEKVGSHDQCLMNTITTTKPLSQNLGVGYGSSTI